MRFGLVGALATLVHMAIGTILVQSGWQPLAANAFAFATAFLVSFAGHLGFSFADQQPDPAAALWRYGLVALAGFLCNEAILALLLAARLIPAAAALWVSTACAAVLTFGLAKAWAFGRRPAPA
nr:GtrA family protein [Paracoccus sp. S-4012]